MVNGRAHPKMWVGTPGYEEVVTVLKESQASQEAGNMLAWAGGAFDPEAFDRRAINNGLLRMGWNGWGKK